MHPADTPECRLRIGFLRLTDAAPVIVAHEFGFFADEGIDTELALEPSWANIADKLAYGFLDAAVIVPPLAFAIALGLRGQPQPLIVPCAISLGGNTITLVRNVATAMRKIEKEEGIGSGAALRRHLTQAGQSLTLGVVHAYSTHNLLLRYWLAAAGIDPKVDVKLIVVPPSRAVEALQSGDIAGFCAGAPWGEIARRAGIGETAATSNDVWQNHPEKAFALSTAWVEHNPNGLNGAIRALARAAQFCDAPENASYIGSLLSRQKYLNVDAHAILSSLPGAITPDNVSIFFRNAATFPWRSQAQWFLREMKRWRLIEESVDISKLAAQVYRPDLYRAAIGPLGIAAPLQDLKAEGAHDSLWKIATATASIPMSRDSFCDGAIFQPK
jgi:ABC-type nitrate/sulfonate/bicarbonate transport system substrate-binding protein